MSDVKVRVEQEASTTLLSSGNSPESWSMERWKCVAKFSRLVNKFAAKIWRGSPISNLCSIFWKTTQSQLFLLWEEPNLKTRKLKIKLSNKNIFFQQLIIWDNRKSCTYPLLLISNSLYVQQYTLPSANGLHISIYQDTLNESRDPDRGLDSDRYTARWSSRVPRPRSSALSLPSCV